MVSQKYGEAHVDTLEKHYGRGDGAIVNSVTIKGEWFELRLYLSFLMLKIGTMTSCYY